MWNQSTVGERFEDLELIRQEIRHILNQELKPYVEKSEENEEFYFKAHQKLGEKGFLTPGFPSPYGLDDFMAQAILSDEMGRVSCGFGLSSMASTILFGLNVAKRGTDWQKSTYLPGIVDGTKIGCWALTEPNVGSNAVGIETTCRRDGNNYIINGSKTFITNAPIADYFIVLCRDLSIQSADPFEGGTAIIIEKGQKGVDLSSPIKKLGHRSSPTGQIFFNNVTVNSSQVLGVPSKAFYDMKESLDIERALFSGLAIGLMKASLEKMIDYGHERHQFKRPIISYQLYQERIARAKAKIYLLESSYISLIKMISEKRPINGEAAALKLLGAQMCVETASDAVQALGGNGYTSEYEVERYLRDAKLFEIGGGTSDMQKLILAKVAIEEQVRSR